MVIGRAGVEVGRWAAGVAGARGAGAVAGGAVAEDPAAALCLSAVGDGGGVREAASAAGSGVGSGTIVDVAAGEGPVAGGSAPRAALPASEATGRSRDQGLK